MPRVQQAIKSLEPIDRELHALRHYRIARSRRREAGDRDHWGAWRKAVLPRRQVSRTSCQWRLAAGEHRRCRTSSGSRDYGQFDALAEEYSQRYRRGDRPSLQEYVDRLPEMADEIREMFPTLVEVEQAEGNARDGALQLSPPAVPLPGQVGDFRILREVGRGGMGVVYEAEQVSLGRRVALKVLPGHVVGDGKALQRFRREAKAAAKLHHTNIVPVFEVGRDRDTAFYAMQFIEGQGLDRVIDELGRLRAGHGRSSGKARRRNRTPRESCRGHRNGKRGDSRPAQPTAWASRRIAPERPTGDRKAELIRGCRVRSHRSRDDRTGRPGRDHWRRGDEPRPDMVTRPCHNRGPASPRDSAGRRWVDFGRAAGRHGHLVGRILRPAAAVLPDRGADWPPGRPGAGLRPRPRRRSSRHQAIEPAAGHRRGRLDHRFRPGQGRGRRVDGHRRHPGDAPLHGPRAVPRPG